MQLNGKGFLAEINVTFFVDVMLVLLIIFMYEQIDSSLPRKDLPRKAIYKASISDVLPQPFGPDISVVPGSKSSIFSE